MTEPDRNTPEYKSTRLRAPDRPLLVLPHTLSEITGPVYGHERMGELDNDLTRQHAGEPLGERIIVTGRVLDERRPAGAATRWSRSGSATPPGATSTRSTSIRRRSTRTSPAPAGR